MSARQDARVPPGGASQGRERAREIVERLQRDAMWQVPCESCGASSWMNSDDAEDIIAAALDEARVASALNASDAGARIIECASCHKQPSADPTVVLRRINVKGIPGVFLCQWCLPALDPPRGDHSQSARPEGERSGGAP